MTELERILALFLAAVVLAAAARRTGVPYPVFLAVGGALLAFVPGTPAFALPPDLVLAVFVAPVLLDAAYDASLRDLKDNWLPVTGLVVFAVGLTTAAVAFVVRALVPDIPWPAAIALGAIVAPPDAVAATAVLRPLRPPQRLLTILEGESMLNDASALLIYRVAVGAAAANSFSLTAAAPALLGAVVGSVIAGLILGWGILRVTARVQHVPTSVILQFISTIGVWLLAERLGLSGVLTTVCCAMTIARAAPARLPARNRIPSDAVWETVVFALNILAFIFIGLQMQRIWEAFDAPVRAYYLMVAAAVLVTCIATRIAWEMSFNGAVRLYHRRAGFNPPRPTLRPTMGSGFVIAWAGMRGVVSLAAALALPDEFPFRGLIVLTAFSVVLGTLIIQGMTLKPLLRVLALEDGDPVAREVAKARTRAFEAALATLEGKPTKAADHVRRDLQVRFTRSSDDRAPAQREENRLRRVALRRAREIVIAMRDNEEIGDNAFHQVEEELDWLEMAATTIRE